MTKTNITSRADADQFWAQYETTKDALRLSDMQCESAFGRNPHREVAFDRDFWMNTYTPEIHAALAVFGQE